MPGTGPGAWRAAERLRGRGWGAWGSSGQGCARRREGTSAEPHGDREGPAAGGKAMGLPCSLSAWTRPCPPAPAPRGFLCLASCLLLPPPPPKGTPRGPGLAVPGLERNRCAHKALAGVCRENVKDSKGLQGDGDGDEPPPGRPSKYETCWQEGKAQLRRRRRNGAGKSVQLENRLCAGPATSTGSQLGHR